MDVDPLTGAFIGKGEKSALEILEGFMPNAEFAPLREKMKLENLLNLDQAQNLSEHQQKETVDIYCWYMGHNFVFRVQDKSHKGRIRAQWDRHQKKLLEESGVSVYDLKWNECEELFREHVNYKSIIEVYYVIKDILHIVPPEELIVKQHPSYFAKCMMSEKKLALFKKALRRAIDRKEHITTDFIKKGIRELTQLVESN